MVDGNKPNGPSNGGPVVVSGDRRDPEGSRVPQGDRVVQRPADAPGRPTADPADFLKRR